MIRQELDKLNLPKTPGVYFWRDKNNKILYIGKATNLRDRTSSYFSADLIKTRGPRLVDMVFKAATVTWIETNSVLEALILEANLIKKHQPYYNFQEKDDKSFNCIVVTKEELPRILLVRQKDIDINTHTVIPWREKKAIPFDEYFGPYPYGSSVREALKIIRRIFPFRDRASAMKDKETFYRQIDLSPDLSDNEAKKKYIKNIKNIKLILQGNLTSLKSSLKKEMMISAKNLKFEEAELLKQKIFSLEHIEDVSLIKRDLVTGDKNDRFRIEAYDIAHLNGKQMVGVMTVVENANANKNEYRKFIIRGFDKANDAGALREVLIRRLAHTEWPYPNIIVVDGNNIQINVANSVLKETQLDIAVVAVTKDERHRVKSITGPTDLIELHKYGILLANNESHRFALSFHKMRRSKAML